MTYNEFCRIITHLRQNYKCPSCKKTFSNDYIHIIAQSVNEGILFIECANCHAPIFAIFSYDPELPELIIRTRHHTGIKNYTSRNRHKEYQAVNQNDILDMYNFLKSHHGDLTPFLK